MSTGTFTGTLPAPASSSTPDFALLILRIAGSLPVLSRQRHFVRRLRWRRPSELRRVPASACGRRLSGGLGTICRRHCDSSRRSPAPWIRLRRDCHVRGYLPSPPAPWLRHRQRRLRIRHDGRADLPGPIDQRTRRVFARPYPPRPTEETLSAIVFIRSSKTLHKFRTTHHAIPREMSKL